MPILVSDYFYIVCIVLGLWRIPSSKRFQSLAFLIPFSSLFNGLLKNLFCIPRPPLDLRLVPVFDPFGMPSGDVQVATVFWIMLALEFKSLPMRLLSFTAIMLIGISRVYLGVHSLLDVCAGLAVGIMTVLIWSRYRSLILVAHPRRYWLLLAAIALVFALGSAHIPLTPMAVMSFGALIGFGCALPSFQVEKERMSWLSCMVFLSLLVSLSHMFPIITYSYALVILSLILKYAVIMIALLETFPAMNARFKLL